ncbi:hypothetical protein TSAR_005772 [Trichomalopsis sarcophagae]|uniref:Uncharacterized protein n=1 Tax=Trichomalopsis sarcophagae TaxID=543379 RepID=A0A232EXM2_9HYME|nr:hypothetical protein TSAR_005772 [Trichomalopsis sarcophagae]
MYKMIRFVTFFLVGQLENKVDELIGDCQSAPRDVGRIAKRAKQLKVLLEELREMYEKGNLEEESYQDAVDYYQAWHKTPEKARRGARGRLLKDAVLASAGSKRAIGESQVQQKQSSRRDTSESGAKQDVRESHGENPKGYEPEHHLNNSAGNQANKKCRCPPKTGKSVYCGSRKSIAGPWTVRKGRT